MSEISIEPVPRSAESIEAEAEAEVAALCEHFPRVRTVKIPDLMRFELRSWQACALARERLPRAIPHLRGLDFDRDRPFPHTDYFREHDFADVLIITGDPPPDMWRCVYHWGVSPVTRPRQRRWWETKNRAVFPADFEPTLKWNRRCAREALEWAERRDTNLYYMPIRTGLVEYLDGIPNAGS